MTTSTLTLPAGAIAPQLIGGCPTFVAGGLYPAVIDEGGEELREIVKLVTAGNEARRPQINYKGRILYADLHKGTDDVWRFYAAA
jgi:hypothetical protein